MVVIAAYAPTVNAKREKKDNFESNVYLALSQISKRKEILMLGDLNARTGKKERDPVVGKYGEHGVNENGLVLEICNTFQLRIMNGYFQHKDIHKYTYMRPAINQKSITDYLIQKHNSRIKRSDV